jgi:hypothetical protein
LTARAAAAATSPRLADLAIAGQVLLPAGAWFLPLVSEYRLPDDTISEPALVRQRRLVTLVAASVMVVASRARPLTRRLTEPCWPPLHSKVDRGIRPGALHRGGR